jgi:drug/metabolite transporter superfamily protein YnfA
MEELKLPVVAWLVFFGSAILEVGGDAVILKGLWGHSLIFIMIGGLMLASYGLLVNTLKWDSSKLLGIYAVFALVSVLCGRFIFSENVPCSTWLGLAIIVVGGFVIQFGDLGH